MFSKTRTIIITLIAALSVVSVGPMTSVASARKKESPPANRAHECHFLGELFDSAVKAAQEYEQLGQTDDANEYWDIADNIREQANGLGCRWAGGNGAREVERPKTTQEGISGPLPVKKEEAPAPIKVETPSTNNPPVSPPPVANE
jgi:hypothetical protein